jgi:hypothetical protein
VSPHPTLVCVLRALGARLGFETISSDSSVSE